MNFTNSFVTIATGITAFFTVNSVILDIIAFITSMTEMTLLILLISFSLNSFVLNVLCWDIYNVKQNKKLFLSSMERQSFNCIIMLGCAMHQAVSMQWWWSFQMCDHNAIYYMYRNYLENIEMSIEWAMHMSAIERAHT